MRSVTELSRCRSYSRHLEAATPPGSMRLNRVHYQAYKSMPAPYNATCDFPTWDTLARAGTAKFPVTGTSRRPQSGAMISTRLIQSLGVLGLVIGARSQGADSCVETIMARTADTCASLAEFAGISVSEFLRSNPLVTRCDNLVGGAVYCKIGTAGGTPTFSAGLPSFPSPVASSSPSDLRTSRDGTCGENSTCAGSRFGRCCSFHGFCGTSIDYCGEGCRIGFGQCGDVPSEPNAISVITVIATSTVRITDTVTTTFLPSTTPTPPTTPTTLTTSTKTQSPTSKPTLMLPKTPNNCMSSAHSDYSKEPFFFSLPPLTTLRQNL